MASVSERAKRSGALRCVLEVLLCWTGGLELTVELPPGGFFGTDPDHESWPFAFTFGFPFIFPLSIDMESLFLLLVN